jgi:hypothetical protein
MPNPVVREDIIPSGTKRKKNLKKSAERNTGIHPNGTKAISLIS